MVVYGFSQFVLDVLRSRRSAWHTGRLPSGPPESLCRIPGNGHTCRLRSVAGRSRFGPTLRLRCRANLPPSPARRHRLHNRPYPANRRSSRCHYPTLTAQSRSGLPAIWSAAPTMRGAGPLGEGDWTHFPALPGPLFRRRAREWSGVRNHVVRPRADSFALNDKQTAIGRHAEFPLGHPVNSIPLCRDTLLVHVLFLSFWRFGLVSTASTDLRLLSGCIALASLRGFSSRCGSLLSWPIGGCPSADLASFFRRLLVERFALTRTTRPFSAASHLIDRRPAPLLGFGLVDTSAPIALFNMLGLPLLLLGVF